MLNQVKRSLPAALACAIGITLGELLTGAVEGAAEALQYLILTFVLGLAVLVLVQRFSKKQGTKKQ